MPGRFRGAGWASPGQPNRGRLWKKLLQDVPRCPSTCLLLPGPSFFQRTSYLSRAPGATRNAAHVAVLSRVLALLPLFLFNEISTFLLRSTQDTAGGIQAEAAALYCYYEVNLCNWVNFRRDIRKDIPKDCRTNVRTDILKNSASGPDLTLRNSASGPDLEVSYHTGNLCYWRTPGTVGQGNRGFLQGDFQDDCASDLMAVWD